MSQKSLQDVLDEAGSPVEMLRNAQVGPNVYPGVPAEYSNWRAEQRAWQESAVLFNQSFHMAELMVEGPDALTMLQYLATNSFANFEPLKAKQYAPVTPYGHVIGDVILFGNPDGSFNLVGRAPALNWTIFHAETGDWDVQTTFDQRTALRTDGKRRHYRFQIQGPNAMQVLEKALGKVPEDLKFFNMREETIGGVQVMALRHGMSGQPGWELYGPWEDHDRVHEALVTAGEEFGLTLVGGRAYGSNALESAWIPSPLPAVYSGDELKAYREWAPATGYEANASLGGSFLSENIEDYYTSPWDLGYGHFVKFDHDFIGREALEKRAEEGNHRKKVTLALDDDSVTDVFHSFLQKDASARGKYFEWPNSVYCMHQFDEVKSGDGEHAGLSTWIGYSANEGRMLSLAILEPEFAEPGTEVTLIWGEENGGTKKPTVEPHTQMEIKATVHPAPYVEAARTAYAPGGWRTGAAA